VSKVFAWILFLSSVACFIVQFSTQQIAAAADQWQGDASRPIAATQPPWQTADASDLGEP
jgi:hypothetical protein